MRYDFIIEFLLILFMLFLVILSLLILMSIVSMVNYFLGEEIDTGKKVAVYVVIGAIVMIVIGRIAKKLSAMNKLI